VRQVAPDCGEITDQWIGDHQCCVVEDRVPLADQRRMLEGRFAHQRADTQEPIALFEKVKPW